MSTAKKQYFKYIFNKLFTILRSNQVWYNGIKNVA